MKKLFFTLIGVFVIIISGCAFLILYLDPFFIYREPKCDYFYPLKDERIQNQGIVKYFDYNSIITGTSLVQNFRTTQFDELFGSESIKIPYSGATFFETAQLVDLAVESGHDIKYVLRSFDINHLADDKDWVRNDLGDMPEYMTSDNVFDHLQYLLNKEILMNYCVPMIISRVNGKDKGHTSFDDYTNFRGRPSSVPEIIQSHSEYKMPDVLEKLGDKQQNVVDNVNQNIVELAKRNPNTEFLYFIPPYNLIFWGDKYESGNILKVIEAEEIALDMMLKVENIKVFCYSNEFSITTDFNNYIDDIHYRYEINDYIIDSISKGTNLLTKDNYVDYLEEQYDFYMNYDYNFESYINGN